MRYRIHIHMIPQTNDTMWIPWNVNNNRFVWVSNTSTHNFRFKWIIMNNILHYARTDNYVYYSVEPIFDFDCKLKNEKERKTVEEKRDRENRQFQLFFLFYSNVRWIRIVSNEICDKPIESLFQEKASCPFNYHQLLA